MELSKAVVTALQAVSVERLARHIRALEGIRHPVIAPQALERAGEYIRGVLEGLGYPVRVHEFEDSGRCFPNFIADKPGTRAPSERVILLAHFDTVSITPGADDNASGIAGLLDLAEALRGVTFERTLQFIAVNLEERQVEGNFGTPITRGSKALVEHAHQQGWDIRGVLDLECIGYAGDGFTQSYPPGLPPGLPQQGNFIAAVGNQVSAGVVGVFQEAVRLLGLALPLVPIVVPGNGEALPDSRRSDNAPFWDAGYPAIMVTDTANLRSPHYHQPTDTLDTLNLDFTAKVCQATGAAAALLAG